MNNTNTGGPAFPTENARQTGASTWHYQGMTLRDYFAAKAMNAIYQDYVNTTRDDGEDVKMGIPHEPGLTAKMIALESYALADAMLEARNHQKDFL